MATKFVEKQDELTAARAAAKAIYDEFPDVGDMPDDKRTEVKALNAKMEDLHKEVVELQAIEAGRAKSEPEPKSAGTKVGLEGPDGAAAPRIKSIGDVLDESDDYKSIVSAKRRLSGDKVKIELGTFDRASFKTIVTLGDINVPATRLPGIVPFGVDETTVGDLVLPGTTDNNTITYMEETTFTNAAATVAEGAAKPESALDFTERTENVRKIATWIPATDELIEDVAGFRSYLEGRMRFMVEREEEDQLLNGDGTAPNISGILDRSIQSIGSTNDVDSIYNAITEVRVDGFAEPTALVIHPLSWQNLRLSKDGNDNYYGPGPFAPDRTETFWGLPVRVTPMIAEGTALVGAFRPYAQVFRRSGITVSLSTEHASYFVENKVAVLAEERLAFAVYRPAAFCKVTGLASS
jgi:HK97 family phage major capsid protein